MVAAVTFTCDVEDHRRDDTAELRFPDATRRLLDLLDARSWRGTFFVVGDEADRHRELVAEIARRGHEVALHGLRHVPLREVGADRLAEEARRGREQLEDLTGTEVSGFRAPQFSLTAETPWAGDALADAGFWYSSSVLPHGSPLFGYPGAPTAPFRWPSGLVELPAPLLGRGKVRFPLGGMYLRVLPWAVTRRLVAAGDLGPVPWLYFHPYDFDPGEPFYVVRDANPLFSPLQWINRRRSFDRVCALLAAAPGAPLAERVDSLVDLPTWSPVDPSRTGSN
ncbi:MAG TPA: polysaccharide deacetylase family protein [Microthrixaceae bacterium]|nr:polysaccharide deacetylase family protein [Microthrixaceae bacterium]